MPRDLSSLMKGSARGIYVPRWLAATAVVLLAAYLGHRAYAPPSWTVQRLDTPDGKRTAMLLRTQYSRQHFVVKVKTGRLWETLYTSPAITNDFRVDLGERLAWTNEGRRLLFRVQGRDVWSHAFVE